MVLLLSRTQIFNVATYLSLLRVDSSYAKPTSASDCTTAHLGQGSDVCQRLLIWERLLSQTTALLPCLTHLTAGLYLL